MSSRASCNHTTRSILSSAGILADQKELKSVLADGCSMAQVTRAGGSQPCSNNPKQHHWPVAGTVQTETTAPCRDPNRQHRPSCPGHHPCMSPLWPQQRCHLPPHSHSMANCRLWPLSASRHFLADSGGFLVLPPEPKIPAIQLLKSQQRIFMIQIFPLSLVPWTLSLSSYSVLLSGTEYFGLEGTFKGHLVQFPLQ